MADAQWEGTSCVLCLQVDEKSSMHHVILEHARFNPPATYYLCRQCGRVIASLARDASESSVEPEPGEKL